MTIQERVFGVSRPGHRRSQGMFRKLHHASLRGRGFGVADWRESGETALLERLAIERPALGTIFDVGANEGGWSQYAARLWPGATIHAFEPTPATFSTLVAAAEGLSIIPVPSALGESSGTAQLFEATGRSGLTSLHRRDLSQVGLTMTPTQEVPVTTVDDYCNKHGVERIGFLKLDVEGHELAVLRGSSEMLENARIDMIQFEFGGTNIDSRTFLRDFVRLLEPLGYRLHRVLQDGVEPLVYSEREEVFVTANYLAILSE